MAAPARGGTREHMGQQTDDALMQGVIQRDGDAFHMLVERHAVAPFRIACRIMSDPIEAEDIAQEAMLRLWDHADRWKEGGPGVAAWLSRVAVNLCLDQLRKKRFSSDEEAPEREDDGPTADALIEHEEQRVQVVDCIEKLPDRQRAAIILTYYEEHSNQMAADMLDMKIKAFESLLFRARTAMRGCIESKGLLGSSTERSTS